MEGNSREDTGLRREDSIPVRPLLKRKEKNEWWVGTRTMLNPHGNVRICWDFLMCFFLTYTVFSEPVFMGFDVKPNGFFLVMEVTVITYFLLDIIFNFRTAFESGANKSMITNGRAVAWRYLCGWFIVDFVSSFPFHLLVEEEDLSATKNVKVFKSTKFYKVMKIVRLLKLSKLARTRKYLEELEDWIGAHPSLRKCGCVRCAAAPRRARICTGFPLPRLPPLGLPRVRSSRLPDHAEGCRDCGLRHRVAWSCAGVTAQHLQILKMMFSVTICAHFVCATSCPRDGAHVVCGTLNVRVGV